jgi:light-harvesting complex 1 beta chain
MSENRSISGLTDDEAKEFHTFYVQGLIGFVAIAVVAHLLVWAWRPWFN